MTVLIAAATGSFVVGFAYSSIDHYILVQFALAGAWLIATAMLVLLWGRTAKLAVWLLIGLSGPVALFYPAQVIALLVSFSFQGFV
ncbi:MAG TPA: hypothetical protein VFC18_07315 [Burkholderiales bacterium]|nr:hypothetical protein [Burkholderiales bacterium]